MSNAIEWNEAYSVGSKKIDDEHKKLLGIINELYESQQYGMLQTNLSRTLDKLADYTIYHFTSEVDLFKQYNYPKTLEHLAEHDYFVNKIKGFQRELNTGNIVLSLKTMDFLKNWMISHILGSDKEFSAFIKSKGTSEIFSESK